MTKLERLEIADLYKGMSDDEIRKSFRRRKKEVGILYSYGSICDMKGLNEIKEYILKDYPDKKDEEMVVWNITTNVTKKRHSYRLMIFVHIPLEDYLAFRANDEIDIL